jgi:GDP-fucose transporter C1
MLGVSSENFHTSALGISLGVASSVTTAVHAIVVKRSLSVVSGTLDLAYYSNLLSALVIAPFVLLSGEIWTVLDMFLGDGEGAAGFSTFMTGVLVTVSFRLPIIAQTYRVQSLLTKVECRRVSSGS